MPATGSANGQPPSGPSTVAAAFFQAIRDKDAISVWQAFSHSARTYIIDRGIRRGLAPEDAAAILDDTADPVILDRFVGDVLQGIAKDLELVRLDLVELGPPTSADGSRTRIVYFERFEIVAGPPLDPLPIGSMILVFEHGSWKVERLIPRPGG